MNLKEFNPNWIPWWLVVILFIAWAPVGLIALVLKLFAKKQSTAVNEPSLQQWAPMQMPEKVDTRINKPKAVKQDSSRHISVPPAPKVIGTLWMKILGGILAFVGVSAVDISSYSDIIWSLACLLGGVAFIVKAVQTDRAQKRYKAYMPIIGGREAMDVEELARTAGVKPEQVIKDLQSMLDLNYFGSSAYLNRELGYLFRSGEAGEAWQEKHPVQDAEPSTVSDAYKDILRDIRRANDEIADPVLSEKIKQLESLTARILHAIEQDPDKASRMDTFLTYYLPTTQKLLDSYARFEAVGVEGENLSQSKRRISDTMDLLIKGFARQLDELYQTDAMDVDSDIRVMETMLKRDTASASDDFGLHGGSAVQQAPQDK